ncbi:hypothetical protein SDC9_136656 [bioreactor metagenome]|uniref:Uncharacterized protein n=1 Tax=bioreactor metagenome TaxID=1076179 RepID=A0A645DJU6_9ZZZZ
MSIHLLVDDPFGRDLSAAILPAHRKAACRHGEHPIRCCVDRGLRPELIGHSLDGQQVSKLRGLRIRPTETCKIGGRDIRQIIQPHIQKWCDTGKQGIGGIGRRRGGLGQGLRKIRHIAQRRLAVLARLQGQGRAAPRQCLGHVDDGPVGGQPRRRRLQAQRGVIGLCRPIRVQRRPGRIALRVGATRKAVVQVDQRVHALAAGRNVRHRDDLDIAFARFPRTCRRRGLRVKPCRLEWCGVDHRLGRLGAARVFGGEE